jgi:hypothetical protein
MVKFNYELKEVLFMLEKNLYKKFNIMILVELFSIILIILFSIFNNYKVLITLCLWLIISSRSIVKKFNKLKLEIKNNKKNANLKMNMVMSFNIVSVILIYYLIR